MKNKERLKEKSILFLVHNYTTFQKDQIEAVAKYFKDVYVIVRYKPISKIAKWIPIELFKKYRDEYVINQRSLPANVKVYRAPVYYLPFGFLNRLLGPTHFKAVDRVIEREGIEFDLIHSHFIWSSGYVGKRLKEKYGKKFIVTGHGYDVYKLPFKNSWWRKRIESILKQADEILTVSDENIQYIMKLGIKRKDVKLISNGYNSELFYPIDMNETRETLDIPVDRKVLLSVGNLESVKGHKYLIDAVKLLKDKYPEILCYIIGGGSLYKELQAQIRRLGVEENVKLLGYMKHENLNKWMNASNLFVLPSIQESFGIVQLEAMACGKPVLATRTAGSTRVISSEDYGLLVEIENSEILSQGISKAFRKNWDREKIAEYAKGYSWDRVGTELINSYNRVLE